MKHGARSYGAAAAILIGSLLGACSLAVDSGRTQCSKDSDCAARGEAFAGSVCIDSFCQPEPKWSCLGTPAEPPPMTGMFQVIFQVQHLVAQTPYAGIKVRLCRKLDVECSDVVGDTLETDAMGQVTMPVPGGFNGYARFEGDAIMTGLFFFNPPVTEDIPNIPISIGPKDVIALLAKQAGAKQDPERGVVLLSVRDCTGQVAAGVTLSFSSSVDDPLAVPFYSQAGLPSGSATETDQDGYGGLLNAAAGTVTFTGTVTATARRIGQTTLLVQNGSLSYGTLVPNGN